MTISRRELMAGAGAVAATAALGGPANAQAGDAAADDE